MNEIITKNSQIIFNICIKYKVEKLYVFGSATCERFNENSDIDLIVYLPEMQPVEKGEYLLNIWDEFETVFNRKVDLLTDQKIENHIFAKNVELNKKLIYDRAIVIKHLPELKKEIENLVNNN